MTQVKFWKTGKYLNLTVKGHAQSDEKGKDLVCCAVSTLVYTLSQYLITAKKQGLLKKAPEIILENGNAVISCKPKKKTRHYVEEGFFTVKCGFALLANEHPENVELYVNNIKMDVT